MNLQPTILIDSREQNPLVFTNLATESATLDAGDHQAAGRFVEKYLYQSARTIAKEVETVSAFYAGAVKRNERKPGPRKKTAEVATV